MLAMTLLGMQTVASDHDPEAHRVHACSRERVAPLTARAAGVVCGALCRVACRALRVPLVVENPELRRRRKVHCGGAEGSGTETRQSQGAQTVQEYRQRACVNAARLALGAIERVRTEQVGVRRVYIW